MRTGDVLHRYRFVALGMALSVYAILAVYQPLQGLHSNDFKHIYLGMQAMLDGSEPYTPQSLLHQAAVQGFGRKTGLNPYVYLPFTGLSLAFLAPLRFPVAALAWFATNHLLTFAFIWMATAALFPAMRTTAAAALLLGLALSRPYVRTLTAGQLNMVLLACAGGSYLALLRSKRATAGVIMGFAACFKLAPGIFLLVFALQRRWRELIAMVLTCTGLLGASVLLVGWKVHLAFLPMLSQMSYGRSTWQDVGRGATFWKDPANQSANSLFTHLLVGDAAITPWVQSTQTIANGCTIALSVLLLAAFVWASRAANDRSKGEFPLQEQALFHSALLLSLLLPSLMWDHYLIIAVFPVAWLTRHFWHQGRTVGVLGALVLYAIICVDIHYDAPPFRSGFGLLVMSAKLFPTLALFVLLCRVAGARSRPSRNYPLAASDARQETVVVPGLSSQGNEGA